MNSDKERQRWMATLAKTSLEMLESAVKTLGELPSYYHLRPPEIGLVMVRGRAGGTGQQFNLGEMTVTRCVVRIEIQGNESTVGFGYVAGRSRQHAELAAVCDALMQLPSWHDKVQICVIEPLQAYANRRQDIQKRQTATTKVNFFTLVRGE
jgi:alpha-D-ribose 1-methylphosphonate 5-triphosphate synthase subunit PhnG